MLLNEDEIAWQHILLCWRCDLCRFHFGTFGNLQVRFLYFSGHNLWIFYLSNPRRPANSKCSGYQRKDMSLERIRTYSTLFRTKVRKYLVYFRKYAYFRTKVLRVQLLWKYEGTFYVSYESTKVLSYFMKVLSYFRTFVRKYFRTFIVALHVGPHVKVYTKVRRYNTGTTL